MSSPVLQNNVKFLVDRKGRRTHAVVPIRQYEDLLEDIYDNALADSREDEGTILKLQMNSKSYSGWVSPENDIYDEVFENVIGQR